jgi:hypothetical protein
MGSNVESSWMDEVKLIVSVDVREADWMLQKSLTTVKALQEKLSMPPSKVSVEDKQESPGPRVFRLLRPERVVFTN